MLVVLLRRFMLESHNGKRLQYVLTMYVGTIAACTSVFDQFDLVPLLNSDDGRRCANPFTVVSTDIPDVNTFHRGWFFVVTPVLFGFATRDPVLHKRGAHCPRSRTFVNAPWRVLRFGEYV
eukprot:1194136-Prorocentrum_minimum.AAC.2